VGGSVKCAINVRGKRSNRDAIAQSVENVFLRGGGVTPTETAASGSATLVINMRIHRSTRHAGAQYVEKRFLKGRRVSAMAMAADECATLATGNAPPKKRRLHDNTTNLRYFLLLNTKLSYL
jgi:hypothetical protein